MGPINLRRLDTPGRFSAKGDNFCDTLLAILQNTPSKNGSLPEVRNLLPLSAKILSFLEQ